MEQKQLTGYPSIDKPWLQYYSEEAINAPLPECTVYEYLLQNNKDFPDDVALIYYGKIITYRDLFHEIDRCANALVKIGVQKGEIVTIAMPSIPETLYAIYACNRIGAIVNMIHPLAGKQELINYINEVGSKVLLMYSGTAGILHNALHDTSVQHAVVVSPAESMPTGFKLLYALKPECRSRPSSAFLTWNEFLSCGNASLLPEGSSKDSHEVAVIAHTGGTTGVPKGVMLTDNNINAEIWQLFCGIPHERQECFMAVLPPFISYGLVNSMLTPLAIGHKLILIPSYKPFQFTKYIRRYRPNYINSIPPYWEALLEIQDARQSDFSCLKHLFYGGDAMSPQLEEKINEILINNGAQHRLKKGLGLTEAVSAIAMSYDACNDIHSVGIPLVKMNCSIVDPDTGDELTYNQNGEICFSGPLIMNGYYNKAQETKEIIKVHKDGEKWLHTGDIGHISEDGLIYLGGRIKRIILTKGHDMIPTKLFPDRIEKVISMHSSVKVCCVISVPDKERVNIAKALIELNDGNLSNELLIAEINELCCQHLPSYMMPETIEVVNQLPRTERGKVDYRALEQLAAQEEN